MSLRAPRPRRCGGRGRGRALASVVVYFIVQNELRGQVDRNLQDQVEQVSRLTGFQFFTTPIAPNQYLLQVPTRPFAEPLPARRPQRRASTGRPTSFGTPQPAASRGRQARSRSRRASAATSTSRTHFNGQHVRLLAASLPGGYAIVVATPLTNVDHELSKIRLWLLLVALGGIGIASVVGLPRRACGAQAGARPERHGRARPARRATCRSASRSRGSDELSRLATTFNAMLQSLDEAQQRQRQLVQDASHELRTPLTSLRTNIEVLATQGGGLPPEEREQLLEDVVAQLSEMTDLITELTELARGEEQQTALEEVRLDLLTEDAIRRTARNHPDVPIEADLAPTTIVGMPASLERAIANLLDNAAKWSPPGEPVEVTLDGGELTVRDHGPGIAEADRPHVFERFYRATSARSMPGSGLGLAIVRQVAEMHGGTVVAEEAPGGGTLMRLRLDAPRRRRAGGRWSTRSRRRPHLRLGPNPPALVARDGPLWYLPESTFRREHESDDGLANASVTTIPAAGQHRMRHPQLGVEAAHDGRSQPAEARPLKTGAPLRPGPGRRSLPWWRWRRRSPAGDRRRADLEHGPGNRGARTTGVGSWESLSGTPNVVVAPAGIVASTTTAAGTAIAAAASCRR